MYPNQPQYPAPAQPQYPQQPAPAAPQYPQAPAPQYPQQFAPAPQPQYQGQPQQFAPGYPQAVPAAPQQAVAGTLDGFFNQPSTGGGKALNFEQVGQSYVGIVTRPINNGDIQQQLDKNNQPQTFKDGRPKFVMKVPLQMQPSPAYQDGLAVWYVKGTARDELVRAMSEAGAPEGPPEAGAVIQITHTGTRPSGQGFSPAKLFQVVYRRPSSAGQQAPAAQPVSAAPAPQPVQQPVGPAPEMAQVQGANPVAQMPVPQQDTLTQLQVPQPAPQPAAEMSPEHQALLAQLTGGQQ